MKTPWEMQFNMQDTKFPETEIEEEAR